MTQKYIKIYPTTDDIGKTPIVVEDVEGLNGVNIEFSEALNISELADDTFLYKTTVAGVPVLISKTVAEMKTELGLPANYLYLVASLTNAADIVFPTNVIEVYNESGIGITLTRVSTGKYSFAFNSTFANFANNGAIITMTPLYVGRMNHLPADYELNYTLGNDSIEIQFYHSGVLADIPTNESINLYMEIVKF